MKYKEPEIIIPELEKLIGTAKSKYWSAKDEATVRRYWGKGVPLEAIAKQVGRPPHAVRLKARHMGLGPRA